MITKQNSATNKIFISMVLAVNLTTTSVNIGHPVTNHKPYVMGENVRIGETTTPNTKRVAINEATTYERAKELIDGEIRGFTKEEADIYYKAIDDIYKPVGLNLSDIC